MSLQPSVKLTRSIARPVERELWGRAAGRCEFSGCNRVLYKSPVTQEQVNIAQMAHVYSFSPGGPRGHGPHVGKTAGLNGVENLILVCYDCHQKIDRDKKGERYSAELLKIWKNAHETRIEIAAGTAPNKRSHVVLYGSRIGEENSPLRKTEAFGAMFPNWNPAGELPIQLSMDSELDDSSKGFWDAQGAHARKAFNRHVRPLIDEAQPNHFSIFGLASQPLLIQLGALFTDKVPAVVYQLHREPATWAWQPDPGDFEFRVNEPANKSGVPVVVFSLSAKIDLDRVRAVLGAGISIWEVTIDQPHNDFLRSEKQLETFRQVVRKLMVGIKAAHPAAANIKVFPAMPVSCAVELGRVRMPKADPRLVIYDQNNKHQKFIETLTIGEPHE